MEDFFVFPKAPITFPTTVSDQISFLIFYISCNNSNDFKNIFHLFSDFCIPSQNPYYFALDCRIYPRASPFIFLSIIFGCRFEDKKILSHIYEHV